MVFSTYGNILVEPIVASHCRLCNKRHWMACNARSRLNILLNYDKLYWNHFFGMQNEYAKSTHNINVCCTSSVLLLVCLLFTRRDFDAMCTASFCWEILNGKQNVLPDELIYLFNFDSIRFVSYSLLFISPICAVFLYYYYSIKSNCVCTLRLDEIGGGDGATLFGAKQILKINSQIEHKRCNCVCDLQILNPNSMQHVCTRIITKFYLLSFAFTH